MDKSNVQKLSLLAITWPIFIESLLHMLLRTTDTFMLSRVSDDAVAAVGVANQLIMFMFFLFQFVSVGAAVVIAQFLGAKKYRDIHTISSNAISMNFLFGIFISLVIVSFSSIYLRFFDLSVDMFEQARVYMLIVGGALFLQAMMLTISAIIQAHGHTRYTMFVSVGMNIINIIGNYVLIFGAFGFPKLGVLGVAIATVFSQLIGVIVSFLLLVKVVNIKLRWADMYKWQSERIKSLLKIGVPSAIGQISYSGSQIVTTGFITRIGPEMLTTRIYTLNILFFIMILSISLARGSQIIVGHLIGAGEMEKAYRAAFKSLKLSILLTFAVTTIIVLFREPLLGLFSNNPLIIYTGAILLVMGFVLEPGRCLNIVLGQTLQAAGDTRFLMMTTIFVIWAFSVPLYYYVGIRLEYGLIGIWVVFIADEWIRGLLLWGRWKSRKWESKALVKPDERAEKAI